MSKHVIRDHVQHCEFTTSDHKHMLNSLLTSISPCTAYTCFTFNTTPATVAKFDALRGAKSWKETGHFGAVFKPDHFSVMLSIEGDRVRTAYQTFVAQGGEPNDAADFERLCAIDPYMQWQQEAIRLLARAEVDDGAEPATRNKGESRRVPCRSLSEPKEV